MTTTVATVAIVCVTYNRRAVLERALSAFRQQSHAVDEIIVVDNASSDDTVAHLRSHHPDVTVIAMPSNEGFGAGLAMGVEHAVQQGHDFAWLSDDDTEQGPRVLADLLRVSAADAGVGVVGLTGGLLTWGVPRYHRYRSVRHVGGGTVRDVDICLVDGALLRLAAVRACGGPRSDLFMMLEDVEFTDRLRRGGFGVLVLEQSEFARAHLGSGEAGQGSPPWRGYYQTRNHLLMARWHRSPREVLGWLVRTVVLLVGSLQYTDRRGERARLRLLGCWHGVLGRTGRTVEPH